MSNKIYGEFELKVTDKDTALTLGVDVGAIVTSNLKYRLNKEDYYLVDNRSINSGNVELITSLIDEGNNDDVVRSDCIGDPLSTQVSGSYYKLPIQPAEFIVKNGIPFREGNVIKYVVRHKKKNGAEDIKKAIHYLQMILKDYEEANFRDKEYKKVEKSNRTSPDDPGLDF